MEPAAPGQGGSGFIGKLKFFEKKQKQQLKNDGTEVYYAFVLSFINCKKMNR